MKRACLFLLALAGCTGTTYASKPLQNVVIPVEDTTPPPVVEREQPPPSGPARDVKFPPVRTAELPSGLEIATVESAALPLVEIRFVVFGGKAFDGEKPGLAALTADMLKDGGAGGMSSKDFLSKLEALGANLSVDADFDKTVIAVSATKARLGAALDLVGAMVGQPGFASAEFEKTKRRHVDTANDAARTNPRWASNMVLFRDLFSLPSEHHPYASYDGTAGDIAKISLPDVRALHKKLFVAKNSALIVAGDVKADDVKALAAKAFANYKGGPAPATSFTDPMAPEATKITVVDRPKAQQSEVRVAVLAPDRKDASFAALTTMNQVLGGGPAARLFLDVREKRSLAYRTGSQIVELAHGPEVLIASAGTQTDKTALALQGILDNMDSLAKAAPSDEELDEAKRFLVDVFAIRTETVASIADEIAKDRALGLPDDEADLLRKNIRDVAAPLVNKIAAEHLRTGHAVIVVSGDAAKIERGLSHFGEVKVLDPTKNFERVRTVPMDATAPLEAPKEEKP